MSKRIQKSLQEVQKVLKKAEEDWIDTQCKEIDAFLNKKKEQRESIPAGKGSNFREAG